MTQYDPLVNSLFWNKSQVLCLTPNCYLNILNVMEVNLLTTKEVARIARVHQITVRRWILKGKLYSVRIGGVRRIPVAALVDFLEESTRKRRREDPPGGDAA